MAARLLMKRVSASVKINKAGSFITPLNPNPSNTTPFYISRRGIASKLFVGGLSFYTTDNGLSEAFSQYGQVVEAKVVIDRVSDRSKGFGFVTFASEDEADKAVIEMNGKQLNGRVIFVDHAKPSARFDEGGLPIARGPPEPAANQVKSVIYGSRCLQWFLRQFLKETRVSSAKVQDRVFNERNSCFVF